MWKFITLCCLMLTLSVAEAQRCTNCGPNGSRQPVTNWAPQNCRIPSLNADHTSFTGPRNAYCQFYDCASDQAMRQLNCRPGGNNYFADYGNKYCNKFVDQTFPNLSTRGRKWMNETLVCLQRALRDGCRNPAGRCNSCESLADWAFDSHPPCYIGADPLTGRIDCNRYTICTLSPGDQYEIATTPTRQDLLTWNSGKQVAIVAAVCPARWEQCGRQAVAGAIGNAIGSLVGAD